MYKINTVNYAITAWLDDFSTSSDLFYIAPYGRSPVLSARSGTLSNALSKTCLRTGDGWLFEMKNKYFISNCSKTIAILTRETTEAMPSSIKRDPEFRVPVVEMYQH